MSKMIFVHEPSHRNPSALRNHLAIDYLCRLRGFGQEAHDVVTSGFTSLLTEGSIGHELVEMNRAAFEESTNAWNRLEDMLKLGSGLARELTGGFFKQYLIGGVLFPMMKEVQAARRILEDVRPEKVIIRSTGFSSPCGNAFRVVSQDKGIEYRVVEPSFISRIFDFAATEDWHRFLKQCLAQPQLFSTEARRDRYSSKVLFDVPYWNWYKAAEPVLDELMTRHFEIFVLCKGFVPQRLRTKEIPLTKSVLGVIEPRMQTAFSIINDYRDRIKNRKELHLAFTWRETEYWEAVAPYLDYAFRRLLPTVPEHNAHCHLICDTVRPDLLVISTLPRSYLLGNMTLICNSRQIPTVKIQHGIFDPWTEPFVKPLLFDMIACGGTYWKDRYLERGAPHSMVVATGWPKFDVYSETVPRVQEHQQDCMRILYLAQGEFRGNGLSAVKMIAGIAEENNIILYIKPHPAEDRRDYAHYVNGSGRIVALEPRMTLKDCIENSDLVITHESTGGIEAVLMGKRLYCLNFEHLKSPVIDMYVEFGVAEEIRELSELENRVRQKTFGESDENLRRRQITFIGEVAYLVDGKASARIADLIARTVQRRTLANDDRNCGAADA